MLYSQDNAKYENALILFLSNCFMRRFAKRKGQQQVVSLAWHKDFQQKPDTEWAKFENWRME